MTRGLLALLPLSLLVMASCSTSDAKPSTGQGGGGDTPASNGHVPTCRATCNAAADCASSNPLEDEAHYACNGNRCAWKGCLSDAECAAAAPQGPKLVCRMTAGAETPTCVPGCTTKDDCAMASNVGALGDATHFECDSGACVWTGCRNTGECTTAFNTQSVVCDTTEDAPAPTCIPTCTTAADCAIPGAPLSDKTHYACKGHRCEWTGCTSTQDCKSALQINKVICE